MTLYQARVEELRRHLSEQFDLIDRDGSGAIDTDELKAHLVASGALDLSELDLRLQFRELDVDGDGEVDRDEWLTVMSRQQRARVRTELLSQVGSRFRHAVNHAITHAQRAEDRASTGRAARLLARHDEHGEEEGGTISLAGAAKLKGWASRAKKKAGGGLRKARLARMSRRSFARRRRLSRAAASGGARPRARAGPAAFPAQFCLFARRYAHRLSRNLPVCRMLSTAELCFSLNAAHFTACTASTLMLCGVLCVVSTGTSSASTCCSSGPARFSSAF